MQPVSEGGEARGCDQAAGDRLAGGRHGQSPEYYRNLDGAPDQGTVKAAAPDLQRPDITMHPAFHVPFRHRDPAGPADREGAGAVDEGAAGPGEAAGGCGRVPGRCRAGRCCCMTRTAGWSGFWSGWARGRTGLCWRACRAALPAGDYRLAEVPAGLNGETLALGWADGAYRFTKYKAGDKPRRLMLPEGVDAVEVNRQAEAIDWLRDLVNTPPCDMGPVEIAAEAQALATEFGASIEITDGRGARAAASRWCMRWARARPRRRGISRSSGARRAIRRSPSSARAWRSTRAGSTSRRPAWA